MKLSRVILFLVLTSVSASAQRFVKTFDSINAMLAANPNDVHTYAYAAGRTTANDGGGGIYSWNSTSVAATNSNLSILKANNFPTGRWFRDNGFILTTLSTNRVVVIGYDNVLTNSATTTTELNYLVGTTNNIQTQIINLINALSNWRNNEATNSELPGIAFYWKGIITNSLEIGQPGEQGVIGIAGLGGFYTNLISTLSDGTFSLSNNTTLNFTLQRSSGYSGTGTNLLNDAGSFSNPLPWVTPQMFDPLAGSSASYDSTAGISNAVRVLYHTGGTVLFPHGAYKMTGGIMVTSLYPINLVGYGMSGYSKNSNNFSGIIVGANISGSLFKFSTPTANRDNGGGGTVSDLVFRDVTGATGLPGSFTLTAALDLTDFNLSRVVNCTFENLNGSAIRTEFAVMSGLYDSIIRYSGNSANPAVDLHGTLPSYVTQSFVIENCRLEGNYDAPFIYTTDGVGNLKIANCGFEALTEHTNSPNGNQHFIYLACANNTISGCHFNRNLTNQIYLETNSYNNAISVCNFNGSPTAYPSVVFAGFDNLLTSSTFNTGKTSDEIVTVGPRNKLANLSMLNSGAITCLGVGTIVSGCTLVQGGLVTTNEYLISATNDCVITGNVISGYSSNSLGGIRLSGTMPVATGNTIKNMGGAGIRFESANANASGNNVYQNNGGDISQNAGPIAVTGNNFLTNTYLAGSVRLATTNIPPGMSVQFLVPVPGLADGDFTQASMNSVSGQSLLINSYAYAVDTAFVSLYNFGNTSVPLTTPLVTVVGSKILNSVQASPPTLFYVSGASILGGTNLGAGTVGPYNSISGTTLQFNSLAAGSGVTLSSNANVITIAASGTGTTINPTDGYLPWRSSATTFDDSAWWRRASDSVANAGYTLLGTTNQLPTFASYQQTLGVFAPAGRPALNLDVVQSGGTYPVFWFYTQTNGPSREAFYLQSINAGTLGANSKLVYAENLTQTTNSTGNIDSPVANVNGTIGVYGLSSPSQLPNLMTLGVLGRSDGTGGTNSWNVGVGATVDTPLPGSTNAALHARVKGENGIHAGALVETRLSSGDNGAVNLSASAVLVLDSGLTGDTLIDGRSGNGATNEFKVAYPSGYGGTGTKYLADDGTYKKITNYVTVALSNPNAAVTTGNTNFWIAPEAVTIKTVTAHLFVPSSSGSVTLELKKNGTTVLSAPVSLTSGTTNATASLSVTAVSAFDRLAGEITAAGTTAYGAQLKIGYTTP